MTNRRHSIHYFIHGRGRGHATRALPIIGRLRQDGHDVIIHAGGDATSVLTKDPSLCRYEPSSARRPDMFVRSVVAASRILTNRAKLVVSDGDLPSLLAARARRIPSILVGHGPTFYVAQLPPGLPRLALWQEWRRAAPLVAAATRTVAVHFLPAESRRAGAELAAPDAIEMGPPGPAPDWLPREPYFVAYFRDSNGYSYARALGEQGFTVVLFDDALRVEHPRVIVRARSRDDYLTAFEHARGVVASAGSNVISECAAAGKPLWSVYSPGDSEQALNAHLAHAAGIAWRTSLTEDPELACRSFLEWSTEHDTSRSWRDRMPEPASAAVARLALSLTPEPPR